MTLRCDQRGVVYAEFLMAFVPFFLLFLGGVQLSLIALARIVVTHAATQAARAAVVAIDDDPYFDREDRTARKHLDAKAASSGRDKIESMASALGLPKTGKLASKGSARLSRVRRAAYWPLSILAPSCTALLELLPGAGSDDDLEQALGTTPWLRALLGYFVYDRVASAVTFPEAPGSNQLRDLDDAPAFADDEVVTVRVSYLYTCSVPLVRRFMCRSARDLLDLPDDIGATLDDLRHRAPVAMADVQRLWRSLSGLLSDNADLAELSRAEWAPLALLLLADPNERVLVLRGEASLPNHGAAYEYASERCITQQKLSHCGGG
jgi:hypothetical protein